MVISPTRDPVAPRVSGVDPIRTSPVIVAVATFPSFSDSVTVPAIIAGTVSLLTSLDAKVTFLPASTMMFPPTSALVNAISSLDWIVPLLMNAF